MEEELERLLNFFGEYFTGEIIADHPFIDLTESRVRMHSRREA